MTEGDFRHCGYGPAASQLRRRRAVLTTVLGLLAAGISLLPCVGWAGRPLTVDDAAPVAPGWLELELGGRYDAAVHVDHYDIPAGLTVGVLSTLEVGLGIGGQIENREQELGVSEIESGVGDLVLGAKWNPLPEEKYWASHALAIGLKLPTASREDGFGSGRADFDLTYIASKTLATNWTAHFNAGCTWVGDPADENLSDVFHTGLAIGWQATEQLEWVAELYSDVPVSSASDAVLHFNGGVRWGVRENLMLDGAAGACLCGDGPDWMITVGFTWSFDFRRAAGGP